MVAVVANAVDRHTFDEFTGRCRLPAAFMQEHGLFNGSPVAVYANGASYLCKAHACRQRDAFAVDRSISIAATHPVLATLPKLRVCNSSDHDGDFFISIIPIALKSAASVSFEPITTSDTDKAEVNKLLQDPITLRILQDACRRLVLHESCVVQLPHPHGVTPSTSVAFRVHKTLPGGLVRIIRATRVLLFQATDGGDVAATEKGVPEEKISPTNQPPATASTLGGLHDELKKLEELIYMAVDYPNLQRDLGIQLPKGVLLSGPPGVGKTLLVRTAVTRCQSSGACQLMLRVINGAEILSGSIGDAEATLRSLFAQGREFTSQSHTHVFCLFLDELDALCPRRDASGRAHSRIVAQLLTLMDGVDTSQSRMLVFGATNLPNSIDPALRRPGRFDREVALRAPEAADRAQIFKVHLKHVPLEPPLTVECLAATLADQCVGFVGADIAALCRQACMIALTRVGTAGNGATPQILKFLRNQQLAAMYWSNYTEPTMDISQALAELSIAGDAPRTAVTMTDFTDAMEFVQASSLRGANTFSKSKAKVTTWSDIGGLESVKMSLQQAVEWPLKFPDTFARLALKPPRGILLYGPPGCSKSTIVRACAFASQATFLSLSAAEVFSPFFGDAEAAIRQVFREARAATPAIVFMDEIDAIVTKRAFEQGGSGGSGMELRVLSTLLNEMDGVEAADGLLVIGATNRPDMIDAALLRPGRFDRVVYVPLPEEADRLKILQIHTKHASLAPDVDLHWVARQTDMFSGAELENVCREAALLALRQNIMTEEIEMSHFELALRHASPVSSKESLEAFHRFHDKQGAQ